MKIGIFGGTFDPPHIGHLILAQEALDQLKLDEVLWVLTPFPPHKVGQKISSLQDRTEMVRLSIEGNEHFRLSKVDMDRDPPHYAADTVAILRSEIPDARFFYLMGADSLNDLPDWHEPGRFVSECNGIAVMVRHGETTNSTHLEQYIPGITKKLHILETPCVEISGSEIRKRAAMGRPFRYFLPGSIYQYIQVHKLYQP